MWFIMIKPFLSSNKKIEVKTSTKSENSEISEGYDGISERSVETEDPDVFIVTGDSTDDNDNNFKLKLKSDFLTTTAFSHLDALTDVNSNIPAGERKNKICEDGPINDDDCDTGIDVADDDMNEEIREGRENEDNEKDQEEEENTIELTPNAILLRAELSDFYSLVAYQSDWVVKSHYLLYPNPYPKSKHLKRRWHGHPIFPVLLAIGEQIPLEFFIIFYFNIINISVI